MAQHQHIHLTADERTELTELISHGMHGARELTRARILLHLDRSQGEQRTLAEVAAACLVSSGTVSNAKRHYFAGGLARALYDAPRPGAEPKVDGEVEAHLIALVCSDPPTGQTRWTLRLLAEQLVALEVIDSISHVTVREVLKKQT